MTVTEVAERLGVNVRTVHRMIKRGQLVAIKADAIQTADGREAPWVGRRTAPWLIDPASVDDLAATSRRSA